jgi:cellulose synthase/poly-beta-1,6-N-acetylglucosamine synthase-like glycosyltransferase
MRMKPGTLTSPLGVAALTSIAVGGIGSLAFMYLVGRHNSSIVLVAFFAFWVSSPFVANVWMWFRVARTTAIARAPFYLSMLAVSLGSLVIYGFVALGPAIAKPAFPFLIIPLISWIVAAFLTAMMHSKSRKHEGA